jgi:hypothetical protein
MKWVILLLGYWRNHTDYQFFMLQRVQIQLEANPNSFEYFSVAIKKMCFLSLDAVKDDFASRFSQTGRPSNQQPELFRSFILMSEFKFAGIDGWVAYASSNPMLCALTGVPDGQFPSASAHRDFIRRLWLVEPVSKEKKVSKKPSGKLGKDKLPPKHPGSVAFLVGKALSGCVFSAIPERLLQSIFMKTAVLPSAYAGLLGDLDSLIVSADGTCVVSNASPYGHKTCDCTGQCSCPRRFADPQAKWGWDSYHERWFFGYTAYLLSVHNKDLKLDLPIYLKFVEASRNDSVTLIAALAHARFLFQGFFLFNSLLADAAHDNYATYTLLHQWNIKPFIDLNNRSDNKPQADGVILSNNGVPICADGYEMLNWGFEAKKYRIKFRCPMVTGKVKECPYDSNCNKTKYGKTVYVRLASDLRLLTPVPRNTQEWRDTYKLRTASERVNNRILTDYQLERPKRYGKRKIAFFAFLNAINVHLDARVKFDHSVPLSFAAA